MKISEITSKNGFVEEEFIKFIKDKTNITIESSLFKGTTIEDYQVNKAVDLYKEHLVRQAELDKATANILVSSGFNFDGYKIVKYSGYISGDDTVQISRNDVCENNSKVVCDALVKIRIQALKELKEAAYMLGCNAVIGVDFDYMTFEPETANSSGGTTYYPFMICVTANGNAVQIEKE